MLVKYVGPERPGVETARGLRFDYDKPVEVSEEIGQQLIKQNDFKVVRQPAKKEVAD